MHDDDWLRAIARHNSPDRWWQSGPAHDPELVGGANELATLLGQHARQEPERFLTLALRFGPDTPAAHLCQVTEAVAGRTTTRRFTQLCTHAHRIAGSAVTRVICASIPKIDQFDQTDDDLIKLVEQYARDDDPPAETGQASDTPAHHDSAGQDPDLQIGGINTIRGAAALAIAHIVARESGQHLAVRLLPIISALATDPVPTVRVVACTAVAALLDRQPQLGEDLAELLFQQAEPALFGSVRSAQLLWCAIQARPERFTPYLMHALALPGTASDLAGQVWAHAHATSLLPPDAPRTVEEMSPTARLGAARVIGEGLQALDLLQPLLHDDNEDVRAQAAGSVRHLNDMNTRDVHRVIDIFLASRAWDDHDEQLLLGLQDSWHPLPNVILEAYRRAVARAGPKLGDIRLREAAVSRYITTIVLRLYHQASDDIRRQCLDVIDSLCLNNALGIDDALTAIVS
jgi:hypothetical protein